MSVFKPFLILAAVSLCSINALAQESAQDEQESDIEVIDIIKRDTTTESALDNRMEGDKEAIDNVFAITQHRQNYLLPMSYITNPNSNGNEELTEENVDKKEAKFQVSVKLPLYLEDTGFDGIYLGFTLTSFWQLYNSEVSKPFRETNYEPEIFWINYLDPENVLWGDEMAIALGISHQSNGRSQPNSRSWNRIYADFIWENRGFVFSFKPWYRIAEDEKEDILEANGDDNPDIYKYMGYFEFSGAYRFHDHEFSFMTRNNLNSDNRGAIQLDWSFPLWGRVRGYAQYFNGYGESLIDYNADVER
ncbi:MAG: phospholipase, partial [Alteromonas sp.]